MFAIQMRDVLDAPRRRLKSRARAGGQSCPPITCLTRFDWAAAQPTLDELARAMNELDL